MAIYNFKAQFGAAVRSGAKRQTIRARGKRPPPKVGDWAHCYTGLRTRAVCRLGQFKIIRVAQISISASSRQIQMPRNGAWYVLEDAEVEQLAIADGFATADEFFAFFANEHGGTLSGDLIEWTLEGMQ